MITLNDIGDAHKDVNTSFGKFVFFKDLESVESKTSKLCIYGMGVFCPCSRDFFFCHTLYMYFFNES